MSRSAWGAPFYACCLNLIINASPPFTLTSVLDWVMSSVLHPSDKTPEQKLQYLAGHSRCSSGANQHHWLPSARVRRALGRGGHSAGA